MKRVLAFSVLNCLILRSVHGAPDLSLMKDIIGKYPVLSLDKDRTVAGTAEIIADESNIGYVLTPLKGGTSPVPEKKVLAPFAQSTLTRTGDVVRQEYTINGNPAVIEYRKQVGFVEVKTKNCEMDGRCKGESLELGAGGSSGSVVLTETFCDSVQGTYFVDFANGIKPKPEAEQATIEKDVTAKECIFTFPYCIPAATCDPGFLFFGFDTTRVYQQPSSSKHPTYTILSLLNGRSVRFTWSTVNGKTRFINYQYLLPSNERIALEHTGLQKAD